MLYRIPVEPNRQILVNSIKIQQFSISYPEKGHSMLVNHYKKAKWSVSM